MQALGDEGAEVIGQLGQRGLLRSPFPHPLLAVEAQRALLVQRLDEQAHQVRVAGGAGVHEVDEGAEVLMARVQGRGESGGDLIAQQRTDVLVVDGEAARRERGEE